MEITVPYYEDVERISNSNIGWFLKKGPAYLHSMLTGKACLLYTSIPVIFYDDEIQIDRDIYTYDDFENLAFLNTLSAPKKKLIIDIYTNSNNINIEINK